MTPSRTLPCGCRLDGRYICREHERESIARFIAGEAMSLVAVGLFVAAMPAIMRSSIGSTQVWTGGSFIGRTPGDCSPGAAVVPTGRTAPYRQVDLRNKESSGLQSSSDSSALTLREYIRC